MKRIALISVLLALVLSLSGCKKEEVAELKILA